MYACMWSSSDSFHSPGSVVRSILILILSFNDLSVDKEKSASSFCGPQGNIPYLVVKLINFIKPAVKSLLPQEESYIFLHWRLNKRK